MREEVAFFYQKNIQSEAKNIDQLQHKIKQQCEEIDTGKKLVFKEEEYMLTNLEKNQKYTHEE